MITKTFGTIDYVIYENDGQFDIVVCHPGVAGRIYTGNSHNRTWALSIALDKLMQALLKEL